MRICTLKEEEQKFLVESVNKTKLWEKELIIYQWYEDVFEDHYESKLKVIFYILNLTKKFVRVEKKRNDLFSSEKKVSYLNIDELDPAILLNKPFIAKRRSIEGDFYLDYYLNSNNKCEYLLEIENMGKDDDISFTDFSEFKIIKNVTSDELYQNRKMAIEFTENNLKEFQWILKCFQK